MERLVFGLTVVSFCAEFSHSVVSPRVYWSGMLLYWKKIKENNVPICASFGSVTSLLDLSPAEHTPATRCPELMGQSSGKGESRTRRLRLDLEEKSIGSSCRSAGSMTRTSQAV